VNDVGKAAALLGDPMREEGILRIARAIDLKQEIRLVARLIKAMLKVDPIGGAHQKHKLFEPIAELVDVT
jgi:hypothetical protein